MSKASLGTQSVGVKSLNDRLDFRPMLNLRASVRFDVQIAAPLPPMPWLWLPSEGDDGLEPFLF